MDLIIWRHAEAEEGVPDLKRKLTSRGHKHAAHVGEWLLARLPSKFSVLASPSERTRQTADALGVPYKTSDDLAPGASVAEVLAAADVAGPGRKGAIVIVGHQPDLGRVVAYLVSGAEANWSIKKGGLWWLSNRVRDGDSQVVVRAVIAPDLI